MSLLGVNSNPQLDYIEGDTGPDLVGFVTNRKGVARQLAGTVFIKVWNARTKATFLDYTPVVPDPDQTTNKGKFSYTWAAAHVAGVYFFRLRFGTSEHSLPTYFRTWKPGDGPAVRY